jgi:parallel beta-helix repeat protein
MVLWEKLVVTMKKISVFLMILCLLPALYFVPRKIRPAKADPGQFTVDDDQPADFKTIQAAINNNTVLPGSTIFVRNGLYVENVVVNKSVSLIGESNIATVVDGNRRDSAFRIRASGVTLSNFAIRNGGNSTNQLENVIRIEPQYDGTTISHNRMTSNEWGIGVYSSRNKVLNNTISLNGFYAIYLIGTTNNLISGNTIFNTTDGIGLLNSNYNNVTGNTVFWSGDGVAISIGVHNSVSGNLIKDDSNGIYIAYSQDNMIYHNNFVNNAKPSEILEGNNIWDNGVEGNYWSDYAGADVYKGPFQNETGSDGIGDEPFQINEKDANDYDNYPLMGLFSDFPLSSEGKEYCVTAISNSTITGVHFKLGTETGNRILDFTAVCSNGFNGFCRMTIPNQLMSYPYVMLIGNEDVSPTLLATSNETYAVLYFTYTGPSQTIIIISSRIQSRYDELLARYNETRANLDTLNATYRALSGNYSVLRAQLSNLNTSYNDLFSNYLVLQTNLNNITDAYDVLQQSYTDLGAQLSSLNLAYIDLLDNYHALQQDLNETSLNCLALLDNYATLQTTLNSLTIANTNLLNSYNLLLGNYSRLRLGFNELNASYAEQLSNASRQTQNLQNLTYIFAAVTAVFIMATVYLSKNVYDGKTSGTKAVKEEEGTK